MAKMTIYVPDDLKADMEKYGDQNWSVVAQLAFRQQIARKDTGPARQLRAADVMWLIRTSIQNYDEQVKERRERRRKTP